ncbi:MAG TPA: ABC transporter permease subunit [Candidatus Dormibacteraeota bacterium]|jgi:ABC-type transport system involved in multi-copper enzyme maturation permease subunit|nr:ABC transporter permease subunit [Candidatus Dormibacteraeota bacterium]
MTEFSPSPSPRLMDVWASARAAWIRIGKRPSTWVLGVVMLLLMASLNYGLPLLLILVISHEPGHAATHAQLQTAQDSLRQELYPSHFIKTALTGFTGFAYCAAIPVILGVLSFGGEYGLGTWKTLLTQRPSRMTTFLGTTLTMVGILLSFSIAILVAGAVISIPFGFAFGHATPWPGLLSIVEAVLAAWLTMSMWAAFGVLLAMLFQQTPLAIGIGIVYTLAVEGFIVQVMGAVSALDNVRRAFPGQNIIAMLHALPPGGASLVSATQGALVAAAYMLVFLGIGAFLLRSRDML